MGAVDRLDEFQRGHPTVGFPIGVLYKYFDDAGGYLAALITYYAFVSLFPLLLLLTTVLGFVLAGDPGLQDKVLSSALAQFPVVGEQLGTPKAIGGGAVGLVVGILGSLYGGLGVAQAVQYAMNTAWAVPKNSRPNPFKARGRSVLLLATAGLAIIGTTVLSSVGASTLGSLGAVGRTLLLVASVAVNAAAFVFAFRVATAKPLTVRQVAPGALLAAVAWQILQTVGVTYVGHVVAGASATNGVFALVLGLLAFLYLTATIVVFCIEVNVVRVDALHPRALLTPFTDNVELTQGDRNSYRGQAKAQRNKGFESIHVAFDETSSSVADAADIKRRAEDDAATRHDSGPPVDVPRGSDGLLGAEVLDSTASPVGFVHALLIDPDTRRGRWLRISLTGIGPRTVPLEAGSVDREGRVVLPFDSSTLASSPVSSGDLVTEDEARALSAHFGMTV